MGILSGIGSAIKGVVEGVAKPTAEYFMRREELKLKKHEMELKLIEAQAERQIKLISEGLAADASWEMVFAQQASSSWKDEYTLVVASIPAILCFIPGGAQWVHRGFDALARAPLWYQGMLVTLFFATVGIRYWRRKQSDT